MKTRTLLAGLLELLLVSASIAAPTVPIQIPTNFGNGADCEVRESNPLQNRGTSTEIASRVRNDFVAGDASDSGDRQSLIYTRFDLSGSTLPASYATAFRLTFRNNNLNASRIRDAVTPNPAFRSGLVVYGLDPSLSWDENTINYQTAPGLTPDGDIGTRDVNADLTFLGTVLFPELGTQNWLPLGGSLVFSSPLLDTFVQDAVAGGATTITLVSGVIHGGDCPLSDWLLFNYLFNPRDQTTLNQDPLYDADITDPENPLGSPYSGASNSKGQFSPTLIIQEVTLPGMSVLQVDDVQVDLEIRNGATGVPFLIESSRGFGVWATRGLYPGTDTTSLWTVSRAPGSDRELYRLRR